MEPENSNKLFDRDYKIFTCTRRCGYEVVYFTLLRPDFVLKNGDIITGVGSDSISSRKDLEDQLESLV